MARMATWSARHRKAVVFAWALIVLVALGSCSLVTANTNIELQGPGEALDGLELVRDRFGQQQDIAREIVVFSHPSLKVDDPAYKDTVEGLMAKLRGLRAEKTAVMGSTTVVSSTRIVSGTLTHYDIGMAREASPFVAQNKTGGDVTFALVDLVGDLNEAEENVGPVLDTVAEVNAASEGFGIVVGGTASINKQTLELVNEDMGRALFLNLPVTFVILALVFGALVAALVPLALALAATITAFGILTLISQSYALSETYTEVVLLMGLATGIDYALFVITRFRSERRAGRSKDEALKVASGTSGKAVVFAGTTVLVSISGMFLVDFVIFSTIALAAMVVVALAVIISVTLLPALLALLGDNVNRLRIPFLGLGTGEGGGVWGFITDRVLARPVIMTTVTAIALLALAVPLATLNLGFNGAKSLPDAVDAKKAVLALQDNFTIGLFSPAEVVVDAGRDRNVFAEDVQSPVRRVLGLVEAETASVQNPDAPYGAPVQTETNSAGDTQLIRIPVNADTGEQKALDAVNHLRKDIVRPVFAGSPARALVTGETAGNIDFKALIYFKTPFVVAFVLGLAFIILLLMFRSIVIPIKAIILNLLSVGAAYGVMVLVFQKGWLMEGILDFKATGIIESWLPLFVFAILFGLSMDYHMFILSRVKELYEKGLSNEEAVSVGIKQTAGTITSAAAIMVAVFAIFAFTRLIAIKQFGVGLGVAILLDATVIRSILLPATMKLLGDWNWYLPSWLEWLPRIKMGESGGVGPLDAGAPQTGG
jgi:RND superfamily putative drug exporter